jgi:putative flippase GtrA
VRLVRFSPRQWVAPTVGQQSRLQPLGWFLGWLKAKLPERVQALLGELAKFGTIGIINIFVNLGVFNLLMALFPGGEVKAKAAAAVVATTSAYFMNRYWTYRHRPKSTLRREYSLFFLFNAVGFVIEVALTTITKYGFGQTHSVVLNAVAILGIVLGTVFRFWAYRTHVFKAHIGGDPAAEAPADAHADSDSADSDSAAPDDASALDGLDSPAPVSPAPALARDGLLDPSSLEAELTDLEFDQVVEDESRTLRRPR